MKRFIGCVKRLRRDMDALNRRMKHLHRRGSMFFGVRQIDGNLMRNLDDAETWLNDAKGALAEFIKAHKGENA